jgi:two-component system, LuxR family, sensor kinase FixL
MQGPRKHGVIRYPTFVPQGWAQRIADKMMWPTVVYSMTASACLTLGFIHALIWWRQKDAWPNLLFAAAACGTAAFTACDLAAQLAPSPAEYGVAVRYAHLALWAGIIPLAVFVRLQFRAGRIWLLWTFCALRTLSLFLDFATGENLNFRQITALNHILFLGQSLAVPVGVPNPWMIIGHLSLLALVVFVADAAVTAWRRGERRVAALLGGSIVFFLLAGTLQTALVFWGIIEWPLTPSLFYLGIIAAMAYELGGEALRARQLALALEASEQQISHAAQAARLGFWVLKYARNEVWATEQMRALFGFTKSERLRLEDFIQRLHPDDRNMAQQMLAQAAQGDGKYRVEHRVVLPNGQQHWLLCQGSVEFDGSGQPLRLLGVSMNLVDEKQTDLQAAVHRNEVTHLLRAASLGELSSALAHELYQPLSAILSNAQAAQLLIARGNFELKHIREILEDIVQDDKRASEVISRMRTLMKKGEFNPEELQANELIQEVTKLMRYDLMAHKVRVVTEMAAALPTVRGDRIQLQQVLINLVLNAIDAMSQKAESSRTITLRTEAAEQNFIQISVADTGTGVQPGAEEQIFQPYYSTKPNGLGLGLSLSRTILLAHGGRLWSENGAFGGAIFYLTIPEFRGADASNETVALQASKPAANEDQPPMWL